IIKIVKSDENNNSHHINNIGIANSDEVLNIVSDDDDDDDDNNGLADNYHMETDHDEEEFLSLVGLRLKTKKP
ncbi:unnamed protein product, partial [Rotaria magnacalcarata]